MTEKKPNSLMRNLGQFIGHIAQGVKTDPAKPATPKTETHEVRREVEERAETAPDGRKVIVRRTTIEEIELDERPGQGP